MTRRFQSRSSALVVSALAAVGSIAAPSVLIFADAPTPSNVQSPPASAASPEAKSAPASKAPEVVIASFETQKFVAPNLSANRPLQISAEDARKFEALVDLYAYAYPLVLSNEIRRETTSRFFLATPNETFYFPRLPDARYRATEFPNVDSIFAVAWLDLAREPQIVVAPANTNAPFSLEIVDAWSNVVASFDEKTLGELPIFQIDGRPLRGVALVGPNSPRPTNLPSEIRVVQSPSSLALVLTRVFVDSSSRSGAFGTRPVVQTLYDFATVAFSTFTSELKEEKSIGAPNATPVGAEKSANAPETSSQPNADAVPSTPEEEENKINQALTPPQTSAFEPLKRLFVSQNAAKYAGCVKEAPQTSETAEKSDAEKSDAEKNDAEKNDAEKSDAEKSDAEKSDAEKSDAEKSDAEKSDATNDATSVSERSASSENAVETETPRTESPNDVESPNRDAERSEGAPQEERRETRAFWREIQEREHEATESLDSTYDGVKRWFYRRLENDKHFWNQFDEALKRDARRDLRQFERLVDTPRPTRPWLEGPVERVARMSPEKYWRNFVELLKTNPPTDANAKILNAFQTLGIEPGKSAKFDASLRKLSQGAFAIARKKIEIAAQSEIWRNASPTNWIIFQNLGDYGDDYLFRAGAASVAFGVNVEKNVVYPFAFLDASGEPLDGAASYVLRFSPTDEPPTDFLWSLTLYDADGYLVPNESGKYGVRSDAPLKRNQDGSVEILIQHEKPQGDTSNWIPAPRGPFVLAMRVYRPNEKASNADWTPPAIQKIQKATTDK